MNRLEIQGNANNLGNSKIGKAGCLGMISSSTSNSNSSMVDIRDLSQGQTFSGQIADIRNGFVTVNAKGQFFHAKFEAAVNISIGDVMNFIVRENDGEHILIAPNLKERLNFLDVALYKALEAAGLPATDKNIDVIYELLKNQMAVDKKSIQQMLSYTFQFPEAEIENLAILVKSKIPVSEGNLEQMTHYQESEFPLAKDIKNFMEQLPEALKQMADTQGVEKTMDFLRTIELLPKEKDAAAALAGKDPTVNSQGNTLQDLLFKADTPLEMNKLLGSEDFKKELSAELLKQWTLEPTELSRENLNEVYDKLEKHMKAAVEEMEEIFRQTAAETGKAEQPGREITQTAKNLQNNMEFIKDINQQYIYAQLPLHIKEQLTHGDLYVFANKKGVRNQKDGISLLLHLDMEYLGGTDILVKLKGNSLKLTFTLEEENSISLLESHFKEVEEKLEQKGFRVFAEFGKKEADFRFTEDFLKQNEGKSDITKYSFDMRA